MIDRLLSGEVTFKIDGFDTSLLCGKIQKICKVISLYTKSDSVYLTTTGFHEKRVKKLCEASSCICEVIERKGAIFKARKYFGRAGLFAGALLMSALIFYLSNVVMKVEINGTSDRGAIKEIREILREEGVKAGAYIPSINFIELSNRLFTHSDNIAWASVGSRGSVIVVNVSTPTDKNNSEESRIPCNIVASRDAVVVDAEVMVGQLSVLIGDAVYKGQMLVSGIVDRQNGIARYYHSYARIVGRYDETVEFKQNFAEETVLSGKKLYRKSLNFFELEIPLPGELLDQSADYAVRKQTTPVKLFGITLPISVNTYEYTERISSLALYSPEEALKMLYDRLDNYEKNILGGIKIIERSVSESRSESGVKLTVKYTLESDIGRDSEIYIK